MTELFLGVQMVLAGSLMWSCFCRLVKTDRDTYREVRWSFVLEGAAAGLVLGAPFLPVLMPNEMRWPAGTTPEWVWLTLLLAVALVQIVTSRHWQHGAAPAVFQKPWTMEKGPVGGGWAIAGITLLVAAFVAGPRMAIAQAQEEEQSVVVTFPQGGGVACPFPEGCVAMRAALFEQVVRKLQAGEQCRERNST